MKDLPEVKTSESSQRFYPNKKLIVMDYLPCTYKIPIPNILLHIF